MIHNAKREDQERTRRNLLHEAKVFSALGDHPNLPMIFHVVASYCSGGFCESIATVHCHCPHAMTVRDMISGIGICFQS